MISDLELPVRTWSTVAIDYVEHSAFSVFGVLVFLQDFWVDWVRRYLTFEASN
jgi:hypothetical protein